MALFTGDITAKNTFILDNASLGRYPTSQREWNEFIKELAKYIVEYEGTYSPLGTGFNGAFNFGVTYYRYGKIVVLKFDVQEEDSNLAVFTLAAMPARIRPTVQQIVPITGLVDNNVPVTTCGQAKILTDGTIVFGIDGAEAGFATSGKKGFGDIAGNSIIYSLFDANKID